jgi:hypothetical protein
MDTLAIYARAGFLLPHPVSHKVPFLQTGHFLSAECGILLNQTTNITKELLMSLLDDDYVTEFQELCRKEFGIELTRADAYDQATRLLGLYKFVYRPMSEEQYKAMLELHRQEQEKPTKPDNT